MKIKEDEEEKNIFQCKENKICLPHSSLFSFSPLSHRKWLIAVYGWDGNKSFFLGSQQKIFNIDNK